MHFGSRMSDSYQLQLDAPLRQSQQPEASYHGGVSESIDSQKSQSEFQQAIPRWKHDIGIGIRFGLAARQLLAIRASSDAK